MELFIKISQFFVSLSLLIALHELGHYLAAKAFKTRVEKFYLFFDFLFPLSNVLNFSLFKKKIGDTEYGLGWFPFGGYVKIAGMVDETTEKGELAGPPQPWEFRSKPAWQRLIIILGGIIVNVILGILIYVMMLWVWGDKYLPNSEVKNGVVVNDSIGINTGFQTGDKFVSIDGQPIENFNQIVPTILIEVAKEVEVERNGEIVKVSISDDFIKETIKGGKAAIMMFEPRVPFIVVDVMKDGAAAKAGIQKDDKIVAINGTPIQFFDEGAAMLKSLKNQNVPIVVERNGEQKEMLVDISEEGLIQVQRASFLDMEKYGLFTMKVKEYSFFSAIPAGIKKTGEMLGGYIKQFKLIFSPKTEAYKQVGGFATMVKTFPGYWDWKSFWAITAFFSLALAFMNFLPIPMLDGGYMVFILYEMITGRQPSDKFMEVANTVGFVLVIGLLLFANGNDIFRAFK